MTRDPYHEVVVTVSIELRRRDYSDTGRIRARTEAAYSRTATVQLGQSRDDRWTGQRAAIRAVVEGHVREFLDSGIPETAGASHVG